ncbi:FumA C-terminus/TtdB family hydratase beta subunit [Methanorbis furvi]|uniref:L(+)-tartrate dehydratase subunit beta n=1 Tax=Methanorbis furvi TaxID=3028299 RepID=A0AAE4SC85_9EURY|nr:L(+)-tartrate dehydratase subunit beta [Methanocorpusculaceae archaeon Ag1]
MIHLTTPLGAEVLDLKAGDRVLLSGTIYTARDEAHLKIREDGFPFDPNGAVIYHCGPVVDTEKNVIVAAGPTTSARMNSLTRPMIDAGVRALIGKGGMSAEAREALSGRAVYFAFTGGCAALAASCMELAACHYPELGMAEAVWEIRIKDMPLVVGIDAHGGDLFDDVAKSAAERYRQLHWEK